MSTAGSARARRSRSSSRYLLEAPTPARSRGSQKRRRRLAISRPVGPTQPSTFASWLGADGPTQRRARTPKRSAAAPLAGACVVRQLQPDAAGSELGVVASSGTTSGAGVEGDASEAPASEPASVAGLGWLPASTPASLDSAAVPMGSPAHDRTGDDRARVPVPAETTLTGAAKGRMPRAPCAPSAHRFDPRAWPVSPSMRATPRGARRSAL
jgi:hypothetical protein